MKEKLIFIATSLPYAFFITMQPVYFYYPETHLRQKLGFFMLFCWSILCILSCRINKFRYYIFGVVTSTVISCVLAGVLYTEHWDFGRVYWYFPFDSLYLFAFYYAANVLGIQLVLWLQYRFLKFLYIKVMKYCDMRWKKIAVGVLVIGMISAIVLGIKIADRNPVRFLEETSYIEIEWTSYKGTAPNSYVYKERDTEMFQAIVEEFETKTYDKKFYICQGNRSIGKKFIFYNEKQKKIGEIAIHTPYFMEINKRHWYPDPELRLEFLQYMLRETVKDGKWSKIK